MGDRETNERVVRRILEAVGNRDVSAFQAALHPDIVWHEIGTGNPMGGEYRGIGSVMTLIAGIFEATGDSMRLDVHDVTSSDRHVVALVRLVADRDQRHLDDNTVFVAALADQRVTEVWSYAADQITANAFWA